MKKPSLEEVREYFKDVKEVIPVGDTKKVNITKKITKNIHEWYGHFWVDLDYSVYKGISVLLWDADSDEYAKILTYKEPKEETFFISREQLHSIESGNTKPSYLFPEAFEIELNKWYKWIGINPTIGFVIRKSKHTDCYVFGYNVKGMCQEKGNTYDSLHKSNLTEATPEEVKEALTKEAVKRGFVDGIYFKDVHTKSEFKLSKLHYADDSNDLRGYEGCVFYGGQWAEIILTITKAEAEQKYNCKII